MPESVQHAARAGLTTDKSNAAHAGRALQKAEQTKQAVEWSGNGIWLTVSEQGSLKLSLLCTCNIIGSE